MPVFMDKTILLMQDPFTVTLTVKIIIWLPMPSILVLGDNLITWADIMLTFGVLSTLPLPIGPLYLDTTVKLQFLVSLVFHLEQLTTLLLAPLSIPKLS